MFRTCINIQVAVKFVTKAGFGEHSANCFPDYGFRLTSKKILGGGETLASGISGVMYINLVSQLLSCETNFFCIDNDYIITTVQVGGEVHLVLSAEHHCNLRSKSTYDLVVSINHYPFLVDCVRGSRHCFVA